MLGGGLPALRGRRIDLLKIDVDMGLVNLAGELAKVIAARAFAVMTIEIDYNDRPQFEAYERLGCMAADHDYAAVLKVPCAGCGSWVDSIGRRFSPESQRAAYMPISHRYHAAIPTSWGAHENHRKEVSCGRGATACAVQDVLLLDLRMPELAGLIALGNAECGTAFPLDVHPRWEAAAATARGAKLPSPPALSLLGEGEARRVSLWQDPLPERPREAHRLPDGSFTCRLLPATDASSTNTSGSNATSAPRFCSK